MAWGKGLMLKTLLNGKKMWLSFILLCTKSGEKAEVKQVMYKKEGFFSLLEETTLLIK